MRKRLLKIFIGAGMLLMLAACNAAETDVQTDWTARQMAAAIRDAGTQLDGTEILPGDELYETYITDNYCLDASEIEDAAIWAAGGMSAQEVAVFRLTDSASAENATETLQTYLENRTGAFTGYLPEEAALLENGQIALRGNCIALMVCEDAEAAQNAFDRCFSEEPPADIPAASESGQPEQQSADTVEPDVAPDAGEQQPVTSPETASADRSETEPRPANADVPPLSETPPEADGQPAASPEVRPDTGEVTEAQPPEEGRPAAENAEPAPAAPSASGPHATTPEPESPASGVSEQEEDAWSYSESRLLSAWADGDWSGLAPEDQAILDVCQDVIANTVPADGSDYDKELAVHDWIISHGRYDNNTLSQLPDFQENPNNDNPYGFLVDGVGICLGYTTTFQLFMDLLGIECITVEGTAYNYTADHAWNQVCLDGEWYCVDVTWNDPTINGTVSEQSAHRYFNVTSDHMRNTNHQWDEASVPEAPGTAYAWN